jgi:tetratricopeptide (TPR) repeat protein
MNSERLWRITTGMALLLAGAILGGLAVALIPPPASIGSAVGPGETSLGGTEPGESTVQVVMNPPPSDDDPGWKLGEALQRFTSPPTDENLDQLKDEWPLEEIHSLIGNRHEQVRHLAITALFYVGDSGSLDPLIEALKDSSEVNRQLADRVYGMVVSRLGGEKAVGLLQQADAWLRRRRPGKSLEMLNQAIETSPDFAEAYARRGRAFFRMGQIEQAADDYRRAVEIIPNHYRGMLGLGRCLERLGDLEGAIQSFQNAQTTFPGLELGQAIERLKAQLEARETRDDRLLAAIVDQTSNLAA